jgi:peroxiredoxin
MQDMLDEFTAAGAQVVVVSPDAAENLEGMAEAKGLEFPVLSDPQMETIASYGLGYQLTDELDGMYKGFGIDVAASNKQKTPQLPVPASYVIAPSGTVYYAFVEEDHTQRPEPAELLEAVRKID